MWNKKKGEELWWLASKKSTRHVATYDIWWQKHLNNLFFLTRSFLPAFLFSAQQCGHWHWFLQKTDFCKGKTEEKNRLSNCSSISPSLSGNEGTKSNLAAIKLGKCLSEKNELSLFSVCFSLGFVVVVFLYIHPSLLPTSHLNLPAHAHSHTHTQAFPPFSFVYDLARYVYSIFV